MGWQKRTLSRKALVVSDPHGERESNVQVNVHPIVIRKLRSRCESGYQAI